MRFTAHLVDSRGVRREGLAWKLMAVKDLFGPLTRDDETRRLTATPSPGEEEA